ncbi:MAG TPA: addiction module toxin RelE [Bacteroidales bacterium]|nr:addiction module toxin RelE [Bacteroidales bacterium]
MNINIVVTPSFERKYKRYVKKFRSLKDEINDLNSLLTENPIQGIPLGNNVYKIRLPSRAKQRGKSGGFRVISFVEIIVFNSDYDVYLLSIYDKSEKASISSTEIETLLSQNGLR